MANSLVKKENEQLAVEESVMTEYRQLKSQSEQINKRIKEIEESIKTELKDLVSETTQVSDFTYVVGGGFWQTEFDMETFKKENFDLYVKYLKPKQSKETYALKGKRAK